MTHPAHDAARTAGGTDDQAVVIKITEDMLAQMKAKQRNVKVIHGWAGDGGQYYLFHATHT